MELDRLQAVLRRRSAWEAMDLGFALVRRWARPIWASWLVVVTPLFALIWLVCWDRPLLALLLCWWLKPLWDAVPLHVLSRALFGGDTHLAGLLKALPGLWWRNLPGKLLVGRWLPWRSLVAPVSQLEGLKGGAARKRRAVLARGLGGHALLLAVTSFILEASVAGGLAGLVLMMLPDEPRFEAMILFDALIEGSAPGWLTVLVPIIAFGAMTAVEPFFVAAGFALYLNRRTILEGWDVELVFRRIAARLGDRRSIGAALLLFLLLSGPHRAIAQPPIPPEEARVRETIDEVLARPEFGHKEIQTRWKPRHFELPKPGGGGCDGSQSSPRISGLGGGVAEVLLWGLFGAALVGAVMLIVTRVGTRQPRPGRSRVLPEIKGTSILDDVDPLVLADDPPSLAKALWAHGRKTEAMAVLYRNAVLWLIEEGGVEVPEGATEGDCLRLARKALPPGPRDYFARLTRGWQQVAYAHRPVDDSTFASLCTGWSSLRLEQEAA